MKNTNRYNSHTTPVGHPVASLHHDDQVAPTGAASVSFLGFHFFLAASIFYTAAQMCL